MRLTEAYMRTVSDSSQPIYPKGTADAYKLQQSMQELQQIMQQPAYLSQRYGRYLQIVRERVCSSTEGFLQSTCSSTEGFLQSTRYRRQRLYLSSYIIFIYTHTVDSSASQASIFFYLFPPLVQTFSLPYVQTNIQQQQDVERFWLIVFFSPSSSQVQTLSRPLRRLIHEYTAAARRIAAARRPAGGFERFSSSSSETAPCIIEQTRVA